MAVMRRLGSSGQATIELVMVLPVAIAIAAITVNACTFFGDCAAFDRLASDAVRVYATSPTYGQDVSRDVASIASALERGLARDNVGVAVSAAEHDGLMEFSLSMAYQPTLFGLGLRDSVMGVPLPRLSHCVLMTVDRYKPGVLL